MRGARSRAQICYENIREWPTVDSRGTESWHIHTYISFVRVVYNGSRENSSMYAWDDRKK